MKAEMKKYRTLIIGLCLFIPFNHSAQQILDENAAIQQAVANYSSVKAASLNADAARANEKTAFSLPNPSVGIQSPTGEFYAVGINQNFDFPTVYSSRSNVLKSETEVMNRYTEFSIVELKLEVRQALNQARYHATRIALLQQQDSMLSMIRDESDRKFKAGQIDFQEASFSALQFGVNRTQLQSEKVMFSNALNNLKMYCGVTDSITVAPWIQSEFTPDNETLLITAQHAGMEAIASAQTSLARSELKHEKNKVLPGIQLGYLNQAGRDTPMNMRWQVGITIPLWFWQYSGAIRSAELRAKSAEEQEKIVTTQWNNARENAQREYQAAMLTTSYYIQEGLPGADALASASERFFQQGAKDHTDHLRTLNDVLNYRLGFADALLAMNNARAQFFFYNNN